MEVAGLAGELEEGEKGWKRERLELQKSMFFKVPRVQTRETTFLFLSK